MKKSVVLRVIGTMLLLMFTITAYSEEIWKITSLDWQPYSGSTLVNKGNSVQKLETMLKKEGITLQVEFYPWKRSQMLAKTNDYIGYFPAWPEEVTEGFIASEPIDWSEIAALKKTGTKVVFNNVDEMFKKYKIGIVNYAYPDDIMNASKKYPKNTDVSPNELSLLKKLQIGRIQIAITDPNVMQYLANQEGYDDIEKIHTIVKKELVIALRNDPENKQRIQLINKIFSTKK